MPTCSWKANMSLWEPFNATVSIAGASRLGCIRPTHLHFGDRPFTAAAAHAVAAVAKDRKCLIFSPCQRDCVGSGRLVASRGEQEEIPFYAAI